MAPHVNKYGSSSTARKELLEKRKQQNKEKLLRQKEAALKASVILAIAAISIQSIAFIFAIIPATISYTIIPGILGLLIGGMAIGLVHSDKKKKMFVYIIFTANIFIGVFSGYKFIESQRPKDITEEELQKFNTLNTSFQKKVKEQALKDSLEKVNAIQTDTAIQVDTATIK